MALNSDPAHWSSMPTRWLQFICFLIVTILFLVGIWQYPIAMMGPDRAMVPGDLANARINIYVLEHFHSFITGKIDEYWNAPFMYPREMTLSGSDHLMGSAPFYSGFRMAGFNRESAFQAWIIVLFTLNFWCCFIALRSWSGQVIASAAGAYIFAFGAFSLGQMSHLELLPRALVPFAFLFTWRFLETSGARYFLLAVSILTIQFYCSIQVGTYLLFGLLFLIVGYLAIYKSHVFRRFHLRRSLPSMALSAVLLVLVLYPLAKAYLPSIFNALSTESAVAARDHTSITAYLNSHPAAISWQDLAPRTSVESPAANAMMLFPGGICLVSIFITLILVLRGWRKGAPQKDTIAILLALFLSVAFQLIFGESAGISPSSMAMLNIQIIFFILLFLNLASRALHNKWVSLLMIPTLPILVFLDNKVDPSRIDRFNKWEARNLVAEVERNITVRDHAGYAAIAYMPLLPIIEQDLVHDKVIEINISAMLAAQQLRLPIVNAYTGSYPDGYMDFFDRMDDHSLYNWCERSGCDTSMIARITNLPIPFQSTDTVALQAANGSFICANTQREGLLVADRPTPLLWETYRIIRFGNDRIALLAHNGNFVCAELLRHQQVSATAPDLGDFGLFGKVDLGDGWIALKAHNDRFLSMNDEGLIHASADSIGDRERFRFTLITSQR